MPLRASAGVSESAPAAPLHVYSSSDCSTMRLRSRRARGRIPEKPRDSPTDEHMRAGELASGSAMLLHARCFAEANEAL